MGLRAADARAGVIVRHGGQLHQVVAHDRRAPSDPNRIFGLELRHLTTGKRHQLWVLPDDPLDVQRTELRPADYLFQDAQGHLFMDRASQGTFYLPCEVVGDAMARWMEHQPLQVIFVDSTPVTVHIASLP